MKKVTTRFLFIVLICLLISGCRLIRADEQKLPDATQQEVEMAMSKFLPKEAQLISPKTSKPSQQVFRKDMDGDGLSEGIAFFSKNNSTNMFEVLIVKRDQKMQWSKWDQFPIKSETLLFADMKDVTKDKVAELLVTVEDKKTKKERLMIYQVGKGKRKLLLSRLYDAKVIYDFQQDSTSEVVLFHVARDLKKKTVKTTAEMYDYVKGSYVPVNHVELQGEAKNGNIRAGKVFKHTTGIVVDLSVGSRGGGTTQLLVPKKGMLFQIDKIKGPSYYKLINEPSRDINKDGIIEIVLMEQPKGTNDLSQADSPYVYSWYQWIDGDKRQLVTQSYEDVKGGFRVEYLKKWWGQVKPDVQPQLNQVTFYYAKTNQLINPQAKLFTLKRYSRAEWNKLQQAKEVQVDNKDVSKQPKPILLKMDAQFVYTAILPTTNEIVLLQKQKLTHLLPKEGELKKQLSLLTPNEKKKKMVLRKPQVPGDIKGDKTLKDQ